MPNKLIKKGQLGFQFNPNYPLNNNDWRVKSPIDPNSLLQTINIPNLNSGIQRQGLPGLSELKQQIAPKVPETAEDIQQAQNQVDSRNQQFNQWLDSGQSSGKSGFLNQLLGVNLSNFAIQGLQNLNLGLGLKPSYNMSTPLDNTLGVSEGLSKSFGNPLTNAVGDVVSGGIGKLMGLNTDKVVGGGMAGVNTVSNVLSNYFGPIGTAASVALKGINMLGGKNLDEFNTNSRVQKSSDYTGSAKNIQSTSDQYGGGMVSLIDRVLGRDRKFNNQIQQQKQIEQRIARVLSNQDENLAANTGSADMFRIGNQRNMQDNSYLFNGVLAVRRGGIIKKMQEGGKMNIIPEGALHAHKHHLGLEDITTKGIPVISHEEGGVTQHAEIERNEIVFTKEVSDKLEILWKKYKQEGISTKEKDLIAIQAGELLTHEIIENTDDRTGLITKTE